MEEAERTRLLNDFRLIRTDWNTEDDREEENEKGSDSGR